MRADLRSEVRVTLHAVCLLVARRAALQVLSCGPPMLKQPERLRIVEHGTACIARGGQPRLPMTITAERLSGVARAAVGFATIRLGCMRRHEVRRVIASGHSLTRVTVRTEALCVAARAASGA